MVIVQLIQNYSRGHAEGLSASMFLLAITANLTGSAGILVRIETRSELLWQLPWLVGSSYYTPCWACVVQGMFQAYAST